MVKASAGKAANSKANDSSPVVGKEYLSRDLASSILPPAQDRLWTDLGALTSVCLGRDRAAIGAQKERDFERRPGMLRCGRIVAGGGDAPQPGGLSLGEIDPSRCPPQLEGPRSSGDPTRTAIETLAR